MESCPLEPSDAKNTISGYTVGTLITHTPWWTVQAMGFKGLWVAGGGKKISAHESHGNLRNIFIFYCNKSTQLEDKHSMPSGQVIIDALSSAVLAS